LYLLPVGFWVLVAPHPPTFRIFFLLLLPTQVSPGEGRFFLLGTLPALLSLFFDAFRFFCEFA